MKNKTMTKTVLFSYKGDKVCTTIKSGKDEDEILLNAEFALICRYPNVKYDKVEIL